MSGSFTGAARVAGVVGWPIAHSRSPAIHNYWLRKYGIDGVYIPLSVPPDRIHEVLRMLPALGLRGVNVTVPHKEAAFLAMDATGEQARLMRAVNTVIVREDGSLYGENTDAAGFLESLKEQCPGWNPAHESVAILGAGGASRAIVSGLDTAGVRDIRIVNRTRERAETLREELAPLAQVCSWEDRTDALGGATLVVNATTQGMAGKDALALDVSNLPRKAVVCDIVYVPLETPLLKEARMRGNPVVDGLGMLLHQARPGFDAWFEVDPVVDQELRMHVLSGLPGSPE